MAELDERKPRVLFLCTGNSCRSQMAEALLRHHAGERFDACSAGTEPRQAVHPFTLQVLEEAGIDTAGLHPKSTREFLGRVRVSYAIIVCDKAQKTCPRLFPFSLKNFHWPFDVPAAATGTEAEILRAFRKTRDEIDDRIQQFLKEEGH